MSWPADGRPRFVVARTDGILEIPIAKNAASDSVSNTVLHSTLSVLDRAFCHREVARWRTEDHRKSIERVEVTARRLMGLAEARADELNGAQVAA